MAKKISLLLPETAGILAAFGARLRVARLRRGLTAKQLAERAGMTTVTLRALESGRPGVTMGAYLAVMQSLQLEEQFNAVAVDDPLGRKLQDAALAARKRAGTRRGPRIPQPTAPRQAPALPVADRPQLPATPSASADPPVTSDELAQLLR